MTGDSGEAKDITNEIINAIREEINHATYRPTILLGDFNDVPESITAVQEMIEGGMEGDWQQCKLVGGTEKHVDLQS